MEIKQSQSGLWELYENINDNRETVAAKAKLQGTTIEWCQADELQLDLDDQAAVDTFFERWSWFNTVFGETYGNPSPVHSLSKSGVGQHVRIKLNQNILETERLLIHCLLGSDPKRELLNFTRFKLHGESLCCLNRPQPKLLTDHLPEGSH